MSSDNVNLRLKDTLFFFQQVHLRPFSSKRGLWILNANYLSYSPRHCKWKALDDLADNFTFENVFEGERLLS